MRIGISFDLRNPAQWLRPWDQHYGATLDLIAEAERLGIDIVKFTEHHQFGDGYIPQPLTFMAAVAARTKRIRISTGILIAPLHSAVEIAEQAAVVDCLSGGRVELGLGTGYREPEYRLYGIDFAQRFKLFEARVIEIRRLWAEGGVTPRPVQASIPLWAGLQGPRTSRMAGRLGMGRMALPLDNWDAYLEGLDEGGHGRKTARLGGTFQAMLSEDPERDFALLAPRIEHNRYTYALYGVEGTDKPAPRPFGLDDLRAAGAAGNAGRGAVRAASGGQVMPVLTPEDAAARIATIANGRTIDTLYVPATVSGVIDDLALRNVELIARRLRPLLQGAVGAPPGS